MITPTPININFSNYSNKTKPDVIAADPDIVLVNPSALPVDIQADLILQAMGGTELLYYARHDTVNGQKMLYQPIKDLDILSTIYSPQTIIGSSPNWKTYRTSFSIQLDDKNLIENPNSYGSVYVNPNSPGTSSQIIIELQDLNSSDIIELSINVPELSNIFINPDNNVDGGKAIANFTGFIDGGNALGYNIDMSINGGNA